MNVENLFEQYVINNINDRKPNTPSDYMQKPCSFDKILHVSQFPLSKIVKCGTLPHFFKVKVVN